MNLLWILCASKKKKKTLYNIYIFVIPDTQNNVLIFVVISFIPQLNITC